VTSPRIGRQYYDASDYFEGEKSGHVTDPESPFQRYRLTKVLELYRPGPKDRVVDLGCGWGTFSFALADVAGEVVGVDFSERSIDFCERRLAREPRSNLRFLRADAGDTGLDEAAWDVVVAADLFEHLYPDDSQRVAREAFRLLRPGGRFVTWTPNPGHVLEMLKRRDILLERDVTHVDYKSMTRMKELLIGAGFEIERAYWAESHVPGLRVAERLLQGFVPPLRRRVAVLGAGLRAAAAPACRGAGTSAGRAGGLSAMGWEIERRFLVRVDEAVWYRLGEGYHLRQGYILNGTPSLRIRTGEPRGAVLTSKSGSGIRREEHETIVPDELVEALFKAAEDRVIEKVRWKLGPWELDRFLGPLEGLALLEIELDAENTPLPELPDDVHVLREVTDDKRFVSGKLARMKPKKQRKLVKKAYKEVKGWKGLNG
jgi:CYTH domain-containing protein/2-polyprenyl-3-methyl-5-hydroxy-6-metoxy-1,4-benzoquinol methylase